MSFDTTRQVRDSVRVLRNFPATIQNRGLTWHRWSLHPKKNYAWYALNHNGKAVFAVGTLWGVLLHDDLR